MTSLLVVSLILASCAVAQGMRCFQCADTPSPSKCNYVTQCDADQVCILEQAVADDGRVFYRSGCESNMTCSSRRRELSSHAHDIASISAGLVTCIRCCAQNFCNTDGCGSSATSGMAVPTTTKPIVLPTDETTMIFPTHKTTVTVPANKTTTGPTTTGGSVIVLTNSNATQAPTHTTTVTLPTHETTTDSLIHETPSNTADTTTAKVTTQSPTTHHHVHTTTTHHHHVHTTTVNPQDACHQHHYHYDSHSHLCYKLHHDHKTWAAANSSCSHEGGTLAIVDTLAKWTALKKQVQKDHRMHEPVYIGGHSEGSNDFRWADGSPIVYHNWAPHQPDGGSHDHDHLCMIINDQHDYLWHDRGCDHNYVYICTIYFK